MIPFILVLGNTEISNIEGVSIAGATPELTKFTPPGDAEFLFYDKLKVVDGIPVTPEGHPTPGIITKAVKELTNFPLIILRGGTYLPPSVPHVHISNYVGKDFRKGPALKNLKEIIEKNTIFGKELQNMNIKEVMLGESIPGGTTTAMAILRSMGYDAQTSSASPKNPINIKMKLVKDGFRRVNINQGDFKEKPLDALREFGDPMLASVFGFSLGFRGKVYLAGGTQMLAIAALLKSLNETLDRFKIITTGWIKKDKSSTFEKTAKEIGISYEFIDLDFSKSRFRGLRDYEKGYVKEGVGAGGASWIAFKNGFKKEDIMSKVEEIYERLLAL